MAKIQNIIIGVLLLCGCRRDPVSKLHVESTPQQIIDSVVQHTEDAVNDIPVTVDTAFADTAKVLPVIAIVKDIKTETQTPQNKDTVLKEVKTVIKNPSLPQIYSSYIGIKEATGHNDGPMVEKFLSGVGLGKGNPWCAAFVKYCLLQANIVSAKEINGMALSCVNKKHLVYTARRSIEPSRPGDVFTIWFNNLNRIGHTGFIDKKINSDIYETVEGNTNSEGGREGNGVFRRKRNIKTLHNISRWEK